MLIFIDSNVGLKNQHRADWNNFRNIFHRKFITSPLQPQSAAAFSVSPKVVELLSVKLDGAAEIAALGFMRASKHRCDFGDFNIKHYRTGAIKDYMESRAMARTPEDFKSRHLLKHHQHSVAIRLEPIF